MLLIIEFGVRKLIYKNACELFKFNKNDSVVKRYEKKTIFIFDFF